MNHAPPPHPPSRRVTARPRAAAPVVLQYGDQVSIGGQLFIIGPTLVPAGAAPLPPPPVPVPPPPPIPGPQPIPRALINGYRDQSRNWTGQVHAGDTIIIDGSGLAAATTALFGSVPATGLAANATGVSVVVPALGAAVSLVPVAVSSPAGILAQGPLLRVVPAGMPFPPGVALGPVVDPTGARLRVVRPGQVVTLTGTGYGAARGTVRVRQEPAAITAWTDTAIVIVIPSVGPGPADITVRRPDGIWDDELAVEIAR